MRQWGIGCIVAMFVALSAFAQSTLDATGEADGKTVLWFSGTEVTALIESDFTVTGSLTIGGQCVGFSATGLARGEGFGDSALLTLDVWLLFEAEGETDEGIPIALRGGMAGSSDNTDLAASAMGSASGPFLFIVSLGDSPYRAVGTAEGSAAGAFVVPDDPLTMQMEGIGTYAMAGELIALDPVPDEATDILAHLPWDPAIWPEELYADLIDLLNGVPGDESEADATGDEAEGNSTAD